MCFASKRDSLQSHGEYSDDGLDESICFKLLDNVVRTPQSEDSRIEDVLKTAAQNLWLKLHKDDLEPESPKKPKKVTFADDKPPAESTKVIEPEKAIEMDHNGMTPNLWHDASQILKRLSEVCVNDRSVVHHARSLRYVKQFYSEMIDGMDFDLL